MYRFIAIAVLLLAFGACKKETEVPEIDALSDYAPLKVGKYITYNIDSTVYINLGSAKVIRSYQVRYTVLDSVINAGLVSYRIVRSIRNNATQPFVNDNTFTANYAGNSFEFVDNNLRFIKLVLPFKETTSWQGNSKINTTGSQFQYLFGWDYTYENVKGPAQVGTFSLPNTITVQQRNESVNLPVTPATIIATEDFSKEIYAKGIGLVFKDFLHSEYQKNAGVGAYTGYGIKLTMIDYN
jgi:hypothetical protein